MKLLKYTLLVCVSLLMMACPDDDENPANESGVLMATIDGVIKDFGSSQSANNNPYTIGEVDYDGFSIRGRTASGADELFLDIVPFMGVGTYTLGSISEGDDLSSALYQYIPNGNGILTSYGTSNEHTGTLTVSFYDGNTIKGTFSFEAINFEITEPIIVTNGSFDLSLGL